MLLGDYPVLVHVPGSFLAVRGYHSGLCQVAGVRVVHRAVLTRAGPVRGRPPQPRVGGGRLRRSAGTDASCHETIVLTSTRVS